MAIEASIFLAWFHELFDLSSFCCSDSHSSPWVCHFAEKEWTFLLHSRIRVLRKFIVFTVINLLIFWHYTCFKELVNLSLPKELDLSSISWWNQVPESAMGNIRVWTGKFTKGCLRKSLVFPIISQDTWQQGTMTRSHNPPWWFRGGFLERIICDLYLKGWVRVSR